MGGKLTILLPAPISQGQADSRGLMEFFFLFSLYPLPTHRETRLLLHYYWQQHPHHLLLPLIIMKSNISPILVALHGYHHHLPLSRTHRQEGLPAIG